MAISVSIVEDDRDTRDNLARLLKGTPRTRYLNSYGTGEDALRGIPMDQPDVALVDINLPGISGIECVAKLKSSMPYLQVLMITTYQDRDLIFNSLRAGASGYLLKDTTHAELVQAVELVCAGGAPMSLQIARKVVDHFHQIKQPSSEVEKLTNREQEILLYLSKGLLDKEIADKLNIGFTTVRTHLKHIYEKLHVQSRTEAAIKFLER